MKLNVENAGAPFMTWHSDWVWQLLFRPNTWLCLKYIVDVFVSYKGLQNDHKALMKEIEEALHKLHARDKEKHRQDEAGAHEETMEQESQILLAFAKVDTVSPGSPASMSVSI